MGERILRGEWLYGGTVPAVIWILRSNIAFGSGDHEDAPEIAGLDEGGAHATLSAGTVS